ASAARGFARRSHAASEMPAPLPDLAALLRTPHHRRVGFAVERLLERGQVRERPVDAEFRDRVRIALDHAALRLGPHRVAAPLAPREEELPLRREAVDRRLRAFALARALVRRERELRAGEVADRLAEHELAVVMDLGLDEVALELVDD